MTDDAKSGGGPPAAPSRINRFGRRNVGYILFVAFLIPSGIAMEASGPRGPDAGGGIMFALFAWGIVSGLFFLTNAVLAVVALTKGRPPGKALIACALPIAIVIGALVLEEIAVHQRIIPRQDERR